MTLDQELLLFRALRILLREVNVILYNQLYGEPTGPTLDSQKELIDNARRVIDDL